MNTPFHRHRILQAVASAGDFGDGAVDAVDFEPLAFLSDSGVDEPTRFAAAVGLLVNFCSCIDNSNYAAALRGKEYRAVCLAVDGHLCAGLPAVDAALRAAATSEQEFYAALDAVYKEVCARLGVA